MANSSPNSQIEEFATEERKFLHDLSNPLAVAAGMLEAYREELKRSGEIPNPSLSRKLEKLETALEQISTLINSRRSCMVEIQASLGSKRD